MKKEEFNEAMNHIDPDIIDDYIAQRDALANKKSRKRLWLKFLAVAACLCICITAITLNTLNRLDYFEESCSANIGIVAGGTYYYEVQRDGIYLYNEPNGKTKVLSSYWFDNWSVNDYGIYYNRGTKLFVLPHGTDKSVKLYSSSNGSRIDFEIQPNGQIKASLVGKVDGKYATLQSFFLDGVTGEKINGILTETVYRIGNRSITHVITENGSDVIENGDSILPDGVTVGYGPNSFDYGVMFYVDLNSKGLWTYFIAFADGSNKMVEIAGDPPFNLYEHYVLYLKNSKLQCLNVENGESWELQSDADEYQMYEFTLDGTTVYSCVPWSNKQSCWNLNIDADGKPSGLTLINDNIME